MDFAHLIKDQNSKISDSSPYLEALWARATRNADYNLENRTIERKIFLDHLPLNLQLFLDDCIQKVQEEIDATNTINWSAIKTKYLKSFLYWCLVCGEEQGNLVPLSAAQLYFMLNTLAQQQNNFFVESIYSAALNAIQQTICYDNIPTQTQGVIDQLREFLKRNNLTKPALMNTVSVLNKIIDLDSQRTFNQFDSGKIVAWCLTKKKLNSLQMHHHIVWSMLHLFVLKCCWDNYKRITRIIRRSFCLHFLI